MRISGSSAYDNALSAPNSRWHENTARLSCDPLVIAHRPKFELPNSSRFFCIGSCFARNIEESLLLRGVDVLSKQIVCPREEYPYRPNGIVNKFTTPSIVNELRWSLAGEGSGVGGLLETANGTLDLQLVPGAAPVTAERAVSRRTYLEQDYFARISGADVVLVTLGLIEAWRDLTTGDWLNAAPPLAAIRRDRERYELGLTTCAENVAALVATRAYLKAAQPHAKMIVTVSPVPLGTTFSGLDVFTANALSKATLRAAAHEFAATFDDVDYFPSFEIVTGTSRPAAFGPDCIHVRNSVVDQVIATFSALYMPSLPAPEFEFVSSLYLRANPDVDEAIRRGEWRSGYDHWAAMGKAEGRPLAPEEAPEALYQVGAIDRPESA